MSLSDRDFQALLQTAMDQMMLRTQAHQSGWRFGQEESWHFDQERGELVFLFPEVEVTAPAQIIGTFDKEEGAWMWAWANVSIEEKLKADARRLREYGEQHGVPRLTQAKWPGDKNDCWYMTALACFLCGSQGGYRGRTGDVFVYMTFGPLQFAKRIAAG